MGHLLKLFSASRREKQFLLEAFTLLLLSQVALKTITFRHIYSFLTSRWNDDVPNTLNALDDVRFVEASVSRAARRLPWTSSCLSRSITVFVMLRRRGESAVIFTGVKLEGSSLLAHAWVHAGSEARDANPKNMGFTALMRIG
jgi:Transglutaminase-like superfamily